MYKTLLCKHFFNNHVFFSRVIKLVKIQSFIHLTPSAGATHSTPDIQIVKLTFINYDKENISVMAGCISLCGTLINGNGDTGPLILLEKETTDLKQTLVHLFSTLKINRIKSIQMTTNNKNTDYLSTINKQ